MMNEKTIQHLNPIMRQKADYILRVNSGDTNNNGQAIWEQLWVKQLQENTYELCCIPFYLYNVSLGDEIEVNEAHIIVHVTKPSGHYTFRVWFGETNDLEIREELVKRVADIGGLIEWYSNNLLAVDAPDLATAQIVASYLKEMEDEQRLIFETGRQ
jgi:hypothetical protein